MIRPLVVALATALLAACGPLGDSPGAPSGPARTLGPAAVGTPTVGVAFADCPITNPTSDEHPRNANTAAFSRAWYTSPDRLLWASAGDRFWAGGSGNKVLWERPGSKVSVSGKLLLGDAKAAGVPTITGPEGYENLGYQASTVTFPVPGCWDVEARAATSVLEFVTFVYPREYAPAAKSCVDLKGTFANSDAVLQASAFAVTDDLPGFAAMRLSPKIKYKAPADLTGFIDLHVDLGEIAPPRAGDGYVLFLAREGTEPWQIVCPFRTLATIDGGGAIHPAALRTGQPIFPADVRELDQTLRSLGS